MSGKKCEIWHDIDLSELDKCPFEELKLALIDELSRIMEPVIHKILRIIYKIYNK